MKAIPHKRHLDAVTGTKRSTKSRRHPVKAIHPDGRALPDLRFRLANSWNAEDAIPLHVDPGKLRLFICTPLGVDLVNMSICRAKNLAQVCLYLFHVPSQQDGEETPFITIATNQERNRKARSLCNQFQRMFGQSDPVYHRRECFYASPFTVHLLLNSEQGLCGHF